MKRLYLPIILILWLSIKLNGQYRFDNYKQITSADGLPNTYSFDLAEDNIGFIWIATAGGLARYDGSKVSRFEKLETDAVYLPSQYIRSLLVTGDSLWIGSRKGLSILNIKNRQITNHLLKANNFELEDDVHERTLLRDIYEDRKGDIWLAQAYGGFVKWNKQSQTFTKYPIYPDQTLPKSISIGEQTGLISIIQDVRHDTIMWGVNNSGIIKLNTETGKIRRITYKEGSEKFRFDVSRKTSIYQAPNGLIYSGSWTAGLSIYDPVTEHYFSPAIDFPKEFPAELSGATLSTIMPGNSNYLYLGYLEGLYRYDMTAHTFQLIKKNAFKDKQESFGINFIDSKNRIWACSSDGVIVADPIEQQFKWFSVAELNPSRIGTLPRAIVEDFYPGYISLSGQFTDGIYHVNKSTGHSFKNVINEDKRTFEFFSSRGMSQLNDNTLLVSSGQLLFTVQKGDGKFVPFETQLPLQYSYLMNNLVDNFGTAWFGCRMDGLFSIDLATKKITSYQEQVPHNFVSRHFQDSKGNVWIQIEKGHVVFNRKQKKLNVFHFKKDTITTFKFARNFCECPNGEVWQAGNNEGIGFMSVENPELGIVKKIKIKNRKGHPVSINRIACNQQNELWGMSTEGILKINREDWSYQAYSLGYGLKNWSGMFQFLKSGELFISSRDGFYTVDPNQLKINTELPKPYVTSIISNKAIKNKLEDHVHQVPVILNADENVMTIEFSSINHTLASGTKYQYMLEGIDEGWIDPMEKRSFTYSYLPGGDYIFKIKACNNEGVWNDEIYELPIHVGTPWFKTSGFWLVIGLSISGLAYAYYKDRIKQIQKESQLKSAFEKQKADLEMSALRAQMNPHFIFNCLNSIEAYIIRNDSKKASSYLNNFSRLVRLILQNSRTSYINLHDELEALDLYLQLEQMRLRNIFSYEIKLEENLNAENYEIPPMLIQPFVENSIWHGLQHLGHGGKVKIAIQKVEETLKCTIEDNGIGRIASAAIKAAKKVKRKSMGLNITTERIGIINKLYDTKNEIEIEDLYDEENNPKGTKVTIYFPL